MSTRRSLLTSTLAAFAMAGLPAFASAQDFPKPKQPLVISVIDVAGDLQLSQQALEAYRKAHPDLVAKFVYTQATAPELTGKLMAQQAAGRVDIDFVLTGNDALAAGMAQGIWMDLVPKYAAKFPDLETLYLPGAYAMQKMARGQAFVDDWYPSGPLLEYAPERVKDVPDTAEKLLAWCKAHPGKFMYARPANSGPGRTFVMGLPYLLGDKDPMDPVNGWEKTWAYLKELDGCIEYYPSGTTATMKELGDGTRDIIVSTTGWDINPRVLGIVPKSAEVGRLKGFHWVSDAQYMAIPKGVADEKLPVLLELIKWVLRPDQQAFTYDEGYFYPGPAVKDVPLSTAPASSQAALKEYGRPQYEEWIGSAPIETPLDNDKMVSAFKRWDQEIGASKTK